MTLRTKAIWVPFRARLSQLILFTVTFSKFATSKSEKAGLPRGGTYLTFGMLLEGKIVNLVYFWMVVVLYLCSVVLRSRG